MALAWVEEANIRGPQGPQGSPGAQGPQGPAGSNGAQGPAGASGAGFLGTFQVRDYAADPNAAGSGAANQDDSNAIEAAIAAALAYKGLGGGRVLFDSGTWQTSRVIDHPENVTVEGLHGDTIVYDGTSPASPCVIRPLATHTGTAMWRLRGKQESGRTYDHVGARLRYLTLQGDRCPAGTKGVQLVGLVREATLDEVTVRDSKDTGIDLMVGTSASPQSCRLHHCLVDGAGNNGFRFANVPDSTITDCNSLGATNSGFRFEGFMNGQVSNIRAEWSGQHGVLLTSGYWGSGQGSGGATFVGISTDRNGMHGVFVDATGAGTLHFIGPRLRRDGRNNGAGGGGYAGITVAATATMPVLVDDLDVYPGVDDNGTGTQSPQYGVSAVTGGPSVTIGAGTVHATTPLYGGANLGLDWENVGVATGPTSSPTRRSAGATFAAGTLPATWTPDYVNGPRQAGVLGSAVTMMAPSATTLAPRDGARVTVTFTSTGASRVLTIDGGMGLLTGVASSMQLPTGKVGVARLEYNAAAGRWVVLTLTMEA